MRGAYRHFTRNTGGCPVCGSTDGKCSVLDGTDLHFCRSYPDNSPDDSSWIYRGTSNGEAAGFWGRFVPNDGRRQRNWRETYLDDLATRKLRDRLATEDAAALGAALRQHRPTPPKPVLRSGYTETPTANIEQRHAAYRGIYAAFGLTPQHQQNLSDRYGFRINDENKCLIGTASVGARDHQWSAPFPGADASHRASFPDAMALAIWDEQQRIIGIELRLDNPNDGGRYRWLSRPEYCELGIPEYSGENPLGIYAPVRFNETIGTCTGNDLIGISEGRGMKPRIAASRWGFPVIGGGGHAAATAAPIQLNRYLLLNPDATVLLLVDAGGLSNHRVVQHILRTATFCRQRGHQVLIPWWGQDSKDLDPDPDEVPMVTSRISTIGGKRLLTWEGGQAVPLWTPEDLGLEAANACA